MHLVRWRTHLVKNDFNLLEPWIFYLSNISLSPECGRFVSKSMQGEEKWNSIRHNEYILFSVSESIEKITYWINVCQPASCSRPFKWWSEVLQIVFRLSALRSFVSKPSTFSCIIQRSSSSVAKVLYSPYKIQSVCTLLFGAVSRLEKLDVIWHNSKVRYGPNCYARSDVTPTHCLPCWITAVFIRLIFTESGWYRNKVVIFDDG